MTSLWGGHTGVALVLVIAFHAALGVLVAQFLTTKQAIAVAVAVATAVAAALVATSMARRTRNRSPAEPPHRGVGEQPYSVVLLDVEAGGGDFDRDILERIGHPVIVCNGPELKALCPLLGGQGCPKYEGAHGIVFALDLDRPQHRAILDRYRDLGRDDLPIRVVVTPEQARRYASLLERVQVWTQEPTVADLDGFAAQVEAVDRFA